jgi:hypothetical protein
MPADGNFMEQIATERAEIARDTLLFVGVERQVMENIEMRTQHCFRFRARAFALVLTERLRDPQEAIRDALHRRNHHHNLRLLRHWANETSGMQHTLGAQQGTAAKLKGDQRFASCRGGIQLGVGHCAHTCSIDYGD